MAVETETINDLVMDYYRVGTDLRVKSERAEGDGGESSLVCIILSIFLSPFVHVHLDQCG